MKTNIVEIAKRAGVSTATVSRALNNNGPIRRETRQKILQIAEEFHYKPNPIARSLSRKKTDTIGVILPELVDEFFMEIIRGLDEEAYRTDHYIIISSSHSRRNIVETLLEFMLSGRVDGVVLMAPRLQVKAIDLIQKSKKPVVLLNVCDGINNVVSFNINNFRGACSIVEHLINHGYKKIGMIMGPEGNCDADARCQGFKEALQHSGIPLEQSLIVRGDFTTRSGYYGFLRLMSQQNKPEAIFAANDMMAVGIYEAARNSGIKIPEDIAVVGFDDIYLSRILQPRLTTVHVPIVELGSKAIRYLLGVINGEIDPKKTHREELSTGLVIGGSCGCINSTSGSI
jgi:DNA-binding LacI/PurR family transcriptional regulator